MSTQHGSQGELRCTIGFEFCTMVVSGGQGCFWCYIRADIILMDIGGISVWSPVKVDLRQMIKYFSKLFISASVSFFFYLVVFSFCVCPPPFPFCPTDVWWTRRMSSVTSSLSRCPRRFGTGWPPPSRARWAWCCGATKRSLASAASSMPFRLAYLLRGKRPCVFLCLFVYVMQKNTSTIPPVSDLNQFIWIVVFISPHLRLQIYHQLTQTRVARSDLEPLFQHL